MTTSITPFGEFTDLDPDETAPVEDKPIIELLGQQIEAADKLVAWYEQCREIVLDFGSDAWHESPLEERPDFPQPVFRVFGYAGTGKTTMTKEAQRRLGIPSFEIINMAFTGKAALVMTKHGNPAQTIHSTIYQVRPEPEHKIRELEKRIAEPAEDDDVKELRAQLRELQQPKFELNIDSPLRYASLCTLDEVSMVGPDLGQDVMKFKVPTLVLGDPGQLPPIEGLGYFTEGVEPDVMLTEVRRQAAGNPIIDFATRARQGQSLPFGVLQTEQGRAERTSRYNVTDDMLMEADQVLCGMNRTRRSLNERMRSIIGYNDPMPCVGDKLICLKNNRNENLFNGLFAEVVEVGELFDVHLELKLKFETEETPRTITVLREHFDLYSDKHASDRVQHWHRKQHNEFDFGYAITVHKSQGSQWDNVLLFDDGMFKWGDNKANRRRWVYTGITRAAETVLVAT